MTKVSIIVLSYNSLEDTTKPCLESIFASKSDINYEVIVVDNCSSDGTREYLLAEEKKHNNIRIVLNDINVGFAAGNNIGIKAAQADYYVLLNSDTIVTNYWLDKLVDFFQTHTEVGLLGPVTNSVGNEQKVFVNGTTQEEIIREGEKWTEICKNDYFYTDLLGFYCVAIRREVFGNIGYLDEGFGIGMFEDDDFCLRARQGGYKLACIEDVFIYHKGSVSFNKLTNLTDLFYVNLEYYEKKHLIKWKTNHNIRTFLNLINTYISMTNQQNSDKMIFKIKNKIDIINYHFHLDTTESQLQLERILNSKAWKWLEKVYYLRDNVKLFSVLYKSLKIIKNYGMKHYCYVIKNKLFPKTIINSEKFKKIRKNVKNKRVIIFPTPLDWNIPLFQRPQQLAKAYSKKENTVVIYFSDKHQYDKFEIADNIVENLYLVDSQYVKEFNSAIKGLAKEIIVSISWTGNMHYLDKLTYDKLIYEYIDELSLFTGYSEQMVNDHLSLLSKADVSVATATKLYNEIQDIAKNAILSTNAGDYEFFHNSKNHEINELIAEKIKPFELVLGYYGALASWFDYDLVKKVAIEHPTWVWVLVGWNYDNTLLDQGLTKLPNIIHIDAQHYSKLPSFLNAFDIATLPFVINEITLSTSPVKIFEYMAGGKPIISANLPECEKYASVMKYRDYDQFVTLVNTISKYEKGDKYWTLLEEEAKRNTWDSRTDEILNSMRS